MEFELKTNNKVIIIERTLISSVGPVQLLITTSVGGYDDK